MFDVPDSYQEAHIHSILISLLTVFHYSPIAVNFNEAADDAFKFSTVLNDTVDPSTL
jgi:hypothetical protein